jgi:hypothetical protein
VLSEELEVAAMEPRLVTDPRLADVLEELKKREPIFWEVGASGQG